MEGSQRALVGHLADRRAGQLPAVAHTAHRVEHLRADNRDHPLLRLRDHDLPRLHALLAERHAVEVDVDPGGSARHLRQGRGETGSAAVLQRLDEARLDELERDLDQLLAGEGIADLDRWALVGVVLAQLGAREHRSAADAVAAGGRAIEDDQPPRAACLGRAQAVAVGEAHAHRVDEAVRRVGRIEHGLPADGRHADAIVGDDAAARHEQMGVGHLEVVDECGPFNLLDADHADGRNRVLLSPPRPGER